MDLSYVILLLTLGMTGSFFSGLLGIGGAIIHFPLLLYVPFWFGFIPFTPQQVSSISMFQVFFSSLSGVIAYQRNKQIGETLDYSLLGFLGIPLMFGSLMGGLVSKYVHGNFINLTYGVLAIIALLLMIKPVKVKQTEAPSAVEFHKPLAVFLTSLIGMVAGIVGAGGAFLLVPVMLTVFKIPIRKVIASSLAIVFLSAIGGVVGKIAAGHTPVLPTVFVVMGSLIGAPIGAWVSQKMNVLLLRYILAFVIGLTTMKIWSSFFL